MMPLADLPGLDLAIGPSQRGFTVADQVDRLVSASEADPDMGFMGGIDTGRRRHEARPEKRKEPRHQTLDDGPYLIDQRIAIDLFCYGG